MTHCPLVGGFVAQYIRYRVSIDYQGVPMEPSCVLVVKWPFISTLGFGSDLT